MIRLVWFRKKECRCIKPLKLQRRWFYLAVVVVWALSLLQFLIREFAGLLLTTTASSEEQGHSSGTTSTASHLTLHRENGDLLRQAQQRGGRTPRLVASLSSPCKEGVPLQVLPTLHDKTIRLDPCVPRPWVEERLLNRSRGSSSGALSNSRTSTATQHLRKPKVKILLTNYGWNHPNQSYGLTFGRSMRQRELLQAIVDHPLFDPFGWEDLESGRKEIDPNIRYYVFLDVETCFEANYPNYGMPYRDNADTEDGRVVESRKEAPCYRVSKCPFIPQTLESTFFRLQQQPQGHGTTISNLHNHTTTTTTTMMDSPTTTPAMSIPPHGNSATLVYFDCRGDGPPWNYRRKRQNSSQLALVSLSAAWDQLHPSYDQGLVPPAVSQIKLSEQEKQQLLTMTCDNSHNNNNSSHENKDWQRPYLLTFVGSTRAPLRKDLLKLHNASAGVVMLQKGEFVMKGATSSTTISSSSSSSSPSPSYQDLLLRSQFAAAPRGDNRFSYRFTEILAAGAIPVVYSDEWVLPFRPELVDWTQCAIVIPQDQVNLTLEILQNISVETQCRLRQRCYTIYHKYMATAKGTIDGILQGLELLHRGDSSPSSSSLSSL